MRSTTISKALSAAVAVLAAAALAVGLPGAAGAQETHSSGEIQRAAQAWVDHGAPYDRLATGSRQLVTRSTWTAWAACGGGTSEWTASVRGHGNDLAVVRFTRGDSHSEWTAYYRGGQWTYVLPSFDVARIHTHTAAQLSACQ